MVSDAFAVRVASLIFAECTFCYFVIVILVSVVCTNQGSL